MSQNTHTKNREIIRRYTDQPVRLPAEVRHRIESAWGEPVQLYALSDLDSSMRLTESWLALGPSRVAFVRSDGERWEIQDLPRGRVRRVSDAQGLSGSVLALHGEPDEPELLRVRFTHRQRRAMENLKFVLEDEIDSRERGASDSSKAGSPKVDPDEEYGPDRM